MERVYTTKGTFFVLPTMRARKGIIAMDFKDYDGLLAAGLMNEEIDVVVSKAEYGSEYHDEPPKCKLRGGVYPIEMDGSRLKPQIDFSENFVEELEKRGFRDLDKLDIRIEGLSYSSYHEANYDDVKWGID